MDMVFDCEVFPNCFLLCVREVGEAGQVWAFEISEWWDDLANLRNWVRNAHVAKHRMVGFNNLGFDYPLLHFILQGGIDDPMEIYRKAVAIIESDNAYAHMVWPSDRLVEQLDLYRIHHFDNVARRTSLKTLEFNMRLPNISDLPFPPGTMLEAPMVRTLRDYCLDDVDATYEFYQQSLDKIAFREKLTKLHGRDFMNHSDVKIGKEIFQIELEKQGVQCYEYGEFGRQPRQTQRQVIRLNECVPEWARFDHNGFESIHQYFRTSVLTQTKGAFENLSTVCGGLEFFFGTGGLHASVENDHFIADDQMMILDLDVTSMYPSIAISQGYYPEHLGPRFVEVYQQLKDQRLLHKKGTPENDMLKLALNGVYGASNDQFSIFYDPQFTMQITITGQLALAMLAERLSGVARLIQCNTDGITISLHRNLQARVQDICDQWEKVTGLKLEEAEYSRMFIADVNSYIAEKVDGTVKRKGRYEWDVDWHQNASALVVPKVAEQVLLRGYPVKQTLELWPDRMDFMMRAKANTGSRLVLEVFGDDYPLDRTQRYYVAKGGFPMVKIMPPLAKNPGLWRRICVQKGYEVCPCNNIADATLPVNFDWYANEVDKLVLGVM